jgi:F-type H+-transporting ATPase subunit b
VDLNVTLFGQMIAFALFVFVTMRYIWPPILKALDERQAKIAEGLQAAERSENELKLSQKHIADQLRQTKIEAQELIEQANQRAARILDEGKDSARTESARIVDMAQGEIEQRRLAARDSLLKEMSDITIQGVERILQQNVDSATHVRLVDQLIAEIPGEA